MLALALSLVSATAGQSSPAKAPPKTTNSAATPAQAITTSSATQTLSVQTRLVNLPVTVRDKKGKIVTGLTQADFSLTEDGRAQTIKYFSVDTNLPLTLGLLVDTSGSMRDALDRERSASKSFFDQMLTKPTDKAFLLHFDREVELLQDLTASKDKLQTALGELGPTSGGADSTSTDPDSGSGSGSSGGSGGSSGNRRSGHRGGGGTTLYDAIYLGSDDLMRKQQGRKALIVLSDGEDRGSKETLSGAIEAAQRAETSVYAVYFKGEEHGGGFGSPGNNGGGRRGGIGFPGGGGGGGWPGGGGGGRNGGGGQGPSNEPHVDGKKIMAQIAGETGGRFFEAKKKENLDEIYTAVAEELRTQYTLGYTPDKDSAASGFHKVQLTTSKKDVFVQTRPGYYADR